MFNKIVFFASNLANIVTACCLVYIVVQESLDRLDRAQVREEKIRGPF